MSMLDLLKQGPALMVPLSYHLHKFCRCSFCPSWVDKMISILTFHVKGQGQRSRSVYYTAYYRPSEFAMIYEHYDHFLWPLPFTLTLTYNLWPIIRKIQMNRIIALTEWAHSQRQVAFLIKSFQNWTSHNVWEIFTKFPILKAIIRPVLALVFSFYWILFLCLFLSFFV